ncbi:MAG: hypothetical protein LBR21_01975 [Propionibacteriaceae bacterium]|jgi:hypothetical protein|nr:hypothetical protein [Propionibacteriaceae bacterium]
MQDKQTNTGNIALTVEKPVKRRVGTLIMSAMVAGCMIAGSTLAAVVDGEYAQLADPTNGMRVETGFNAKITGFSKNNSDSTDWHDTVETKGDKPDNLPTDKEGPIAIYNTNDVLKPDKTKYVCKTFMIANSPHSVFDTENVLSVYEKVSDPAYDDLRDALRFEVRQVGATSPNKIKKGELESKLCTGSMGKTVAKDLTFDEVSKGVPVDDLKAGQVNGFAIKISVDSPDPDVLINLGGQTVYLMSKVLSTPKPVAAKP